MKKIILTFLVLAFSPVVFCQVSADCKVSSTYELLVNFDSVRNVVHVTKNENGEHATYLGVSFEQLNKATLNKNQLMLDLATAAGIQVSLANSANIFVIQKLGAIAVTELVDFISVDAQSLGVAAVLANKIQKCN